MQQNAFQRQHLQLRHLAACKQHARTSAPAIDTRRGSSVSAAAVACGVTRALHLRQGRLGGCRHVRYSSSVIPRRAWLSARKEAAASRGKHASELQEPVTSIRVHQLQLQQWHFVASTPELLHALTRHPHRQRQQKAAPTHLASNDTGTSWITGTKKTRPAQNPKLRARHGRN